MKKHIKIIHFWRTYKGLIKLGILLLIIILLASCTINTAANDFCYLYRPVYADYENDTPTNRPEQHCIRRIMHEISYISYVMSKKE